MMCYIVSHGDVSRVANSYEAACILRERIAEFQFTIQAKVDIKFSGPLYTLRDGQLEIED